MEEGNGQRRQRDADDRQHHEVEVRPPRLRLPLRARTHAKPPLRRGRRRTISCKSGNALLPDNYMAHRWATHLGTDARGLGLLIHPILQALDHLEAALYPRLSPIGDRFGPLLPIK